MGIVTPDAVLINPAPDTVYAAGQQLIVIAEDDSVIHLGGEPVPFDESAIVAPQPYIPQPEHTIVLGINAGLRVLLEELHSYVAPGSTVTIVADADEPALPSFDGMPVSFRRADPTQRAVLDSLEIGPHHHVIVLAARETLTAQRADAKTLVTLLHLREIADAQGVELNVVSEMLDDRNRELAEVTKADDFIVSEKLVSLMLSQVSENERLSDVFGVLFDSDGSEVYIRPAELYIRPGATVDFYTVLEAARRVNETAIGYRIAAHSHDADRAYGVHVNPPKGEKVAFAPGDRIIVLAEE
jgi:ion channel POLLUX/CASTOR